MALQQYQARWEDLLTLWASFNRHLARVMAATPAEIRRRNTGRTTSTASQCVRWPPVTGHSRILHGRLRFAPSPSPAADSRRHGHRIRRMSQRHQRASTLLPLDSRIWQVISASAVGTMIEGMRLLHLRQPGERDLAAVLSERQRHACPDRVSLDLRRRVRRSSLRRVVLRADRRSRGTEIRVLVTLIIMGGATASSASCPPTPRLAWRRRPCCC